MLHSKKKVARQIDEQPVEHDCSCQEASKAESAFNLAQMDRLCRKPSVSRECSVELGLVAKVQVQSYERALGMLRREDLRQHAWMYLFSIQSEL